MPIFWDSETKQYVEREEPARSGPIDWREIRALSDQSLSSTTTAALDFTDRMLEGDVDASTWYEYMRTEIKDEHIRQYVLARGGRDRMSQQDWGSVGGMIGSQYSPYLRDFYAQVLAGDVVDGQVRVRVQMYINAAREAYERAFARNAEQAGYTQEKWVLGIAEHCDDCVDFAAEGWQDFDHFPYPGEGATICLTNCQCHKEYRNDQGEVYQ